MVKAEDTAGALGNRLRFVEPVIGHSRGTAGFAGLKAAASAAGKLSDMPLSCRRHQGQPLAADQTICLC